MFLPIGEGTVIDTVLGDLETDSRIDEVFISTNERFETDFDEFLSESAYSKPTLSVEDSGAEDEKFGVIGALDQLVHRESIEDDLVVVAGDNLISFGLSDFIDFFESKQSPVLAAYDVGSREKATSYGLVELEGDEVMNFQEKPDDPQSTLVSIACYAFPEETLPLLGTYLLDGNNPDEPGWFLQWLQSRDSVYAFTFDGAWFDIGTPESYLEAIQWWLEGDTMIANEATVDVTNVGENVHVMPGATVVGSEVTNTIVFPGADVISSTIDDGIVDSNATVRDVDIDQAVVGSNARIEEPSD